MNRPLILAGTIKRLHVDRRIIAQNRKSGADEPAITIQTSRGSVKARRVNIQGPCTFIQSAKPLSCGARLWVETRAAVDFE